MLCFRYKLSPSLRALQTTQHVSKRTQTAWVPHFLHTIGNEGTQQNGSNEQRHLGDHTAGRVVFEMPEVASIAGAHMTLATVQAGLVFGQAAALNVIFPHPHNALIVDHKAQTGRRLRLDLFPTGAVGDSFALVAVQTSVREQISVAGSAVVIRAELAVVQERTVITLGRGQGGCTSTLHILACVCRCGR